jgi:PAS domain S-box-containing protein
MEGQPIGRSRLKVFPGILLLALAYFATGRLGLAMPALGSNITLIWLPTGIAVAALFRWGFRCWPGITLGSVAVNVAVGTAWPVALMIALGNTLAPMVTVGVLRRMDFHPAFDRARDIALLGGAAALGMVVSASGGVAALAAGGEFAGGRLAAWLCWWGGDAMGVIAAAPLLLTFTRDGGQAILRRGTGFATWLLVTCAVTLGVFVFNRGYGGGPWALAFLPLPFVAWASLRFGGVGTSCALIVISVGAAIGTSTGTGPFFRTNPVEGAVVLWIYMATSAVLGWLVSALHLAQVRASGIQHLLERALSDVSLGVLLAGVDRRITYANEGFTRLTGHAEAELLGRSCAILQGPRTDPATVDKLKRALHGAGAFEGEILNYRKDGTTFWNALLISPVRDELGVHTGFVGIQRDCTERKQAEAVLREREERLRAALSASGTGTFRWDIRTNELHWDEPLDALFGLPRGQTVRSLENFIATVHPEDRPGVIERCERCAREGADFNMEFRVIWPDGSLHWLDDKGKTFFDAAGTPLHMTGACVDITGRKQAEAALQNAAAFTRSLIVTMQDGFSVLDANGVQMDVNQAFCQMTGFTREELVGRTPPYPYWPPEECERIQAALDETMQGNFSNLELTFTRRSGERFPVIVSPSAVLSPDGETIGFSATVKDITVRKRAERALQETQKLESLGVLAGGIAHDFNNLLSTILGNANLATMEGADGRSVHEYLDAITRSSLRAAELCKQMLAYSGRGRFVVRQIDLGELVEETAEMLRISTNKKARLHYRLAEGLPPIEADATQLGQVIMNLVINASEAIGDAGGEITISTGKVRIESGQLRGLQPDVDLPEGDYVFLEVADTGCGMSPETQARIFEPFFTTKFIGRGLGLAATLGIVRGHKGTMTVHSEVGRGTSFKLFLPAAAGPGEPVREPLVAIPRWCGAGTVLVVDDEEAMRAMIARMMGTMGLEPVLAVDGRAAVEAFRASPGRFVMVLLDLTMPSMDGEQTLAELRRIDPAVRVVLMSGYNENEVLARFDSMGLAGFLQKPFPLEAFRSVMQEVLEGKSPAAPDGRG